MEWLNLIASVAAAVAAFASSLIAWRVYKRQTEAEIPYITVDHVGDIRADLGFATIRYHFTNPGDVHWVVESATVRWPLTAAIINDRLIPKTGLDHDPGEPRYDLLTKDTLTRTTAIDRHLQHAGARMTGFGPQDQFYETLLLYPRSSKRRINVSIRFSLISKEAVQRKMTVAINRTLTAATKTAID